MSELEEVCGGAVGCMGVGIVGDMQGMEVCAWGRGMGRAWSVGGTYGVCGEGVGMFPICVVTMAFGL